MPKISNFPTVEILIVKKDQKKKMKAFIAFLLFAAVSARHQFSSRITGGTDAKANSVPSFVALEIEFERGIRSCGGFLGIPEDRVITSASCVFE